MSTFYTNRANISPALAVFATHDTYDHNSDPNTISATSLIKPLRQIVLTRQNKELSKEIDVADLIASRMGTAIHESCERAWHDKDNVLNAFKMLGMSADYLSRVVVNPPDNEIKPSSILIYTEQRHTKKVGKYTISGKYDVVIEGMLNDYKSTSVWSYIYGSNVDNYTKQGSIYRWLAPHQIYGDYVKINYIFTDWSKAKSKQDTSYPQHRVHSRNYFLMSQEEAEEWVINRVNQISLLENLPQSALPECSEEELWASETVYKYYKNPTKLSRSTKNFSSMNDALARQASDNNVGTVITVPGGVKACTYCPAINICDQAAELIKSNRLLV